jgi:methionyl-tRNA synthetase
MWPAMLMAAGLALPRRIHAHGWITLGGQKLSKTRGVFIDPVSLAERFSSDAVRWVLLAEIPFDRDGDFSLETFVDRYNADLANDYGNLVSRTEKMVKRYFDGRVPAVTHRDPIDSALRETAAEVVPGYDRAMDGLDFTAAIAAVKRLVGRANKYIEETAPWTLHREQDPRLATVCRELLEAVRVSTLLVSPIVPRAAAAVARDLGIAVDGDVSAAAGEWYLLADGAGVGVGEILFPRLDRAKVVDT